MPDTHNVKVQFDDGSEHIYEDVPVGVSPDEVEKAATTQFKKKVKALESVTPTKAPEPKKSLPTAEDRADGEGYSDEEYEDPAVQARRKNSLTSKVLGKVGVDFNEAAMAARKAKREDIGTQLKGLGEAALSQVTGMGASIAGGLKGLWDLDKGVDYAANEMRDIQQAHTYQPRTATGNAINQTLGYAFNAPGQALGATAKKGVELAGGSEQAQDAAERIGQVLPAAAMTVAGGVGAVKKLNAAAAVKDNLKAAGIEDTRGARMLSKAIDKLSPDEIKEAKDLLTTSQQEGVPLTGPEAFSGATRLHQLLSKVDKSNDVVERFIKQRPKDAEAVIKSKMAAIGAGLEEGVSRQDAANQIQDTATAAISQEEKARTAQASPHYEAAKEGDKQAMQLGEDIAATQDKVAAGEKWRTDAVQQAGKWYDFTNRMGINANKMAEKINSWTAEDKKAMAVQEAEGGKPNPIEDAHSEFKQRHAEGMSATQAAVDEAAKRRQFVDQWKKEIDQKADQLAEHRLPEIQQKVAGFVQNINQQIKLVGADTDEGKILTKFRNQLAPGGVPRALPSQLESIYKTTRNALDVGIASSSEERQTSGVLRPHVTQLDGLIKDVSPEIKQGREIYAEISKSVIDPLKRGPIGQLAGQGADAAKASSVSRMLGALQGDGANPTSIAKVADTFKQLAATTEDDKAAEQYRTAFPNAVRGFLEKKFDKAFAITAKSPTTKLSPAKFADAVASTPEERANLAAMVQKSAEAQGMDAATARKAGIGFNTFMEVLRATGRVEGLGESDLYADPGKMASLGAGAMHSHTYGAMKAGITLAIDQLWNKKAYSNLAKVFTDPDSINKMVQLANIKGDMKAARVGVVQDILQTAVGGDMAVKQPASRTENKQRKIPVQNVNGMSQ